MKKDDAVLKALKDLKKIMQRCKEKRVYAMVTHVSSTGLSRVIIFKAIDKHGNLYNLNGLINKITGYRFDNNYYGLRVGGCGTDVILNTLYIINCKAISYKVIKTSKNKDKYYLRYEGLVNSDYWSL